MKKVSLRPMRHFMRFRKTCKIQCHKFSVLTIIFLFGLNVVVGCKREARREEKVMQFSEQVMKDVLAGMMATVKQQVDATGYPQAVSFCNTFAGEYGKSKISQWEAEAKKQLGATSFRFRRISLKNRNPNNRPDDQQAEILASWEKNQQAQPVGYENQGKIITMLPIRIASPLCLGCHGKDSDITPQTRAEIQKRYPEDKAVGYSLNDIRGAFVTEIGFQ